MKSPSAPDEYTGAALSPVFTLTQDGSPANMTLSPSAVNAAPAASDGRSWQLELLAHHGELVRQYQTFSREGHAILAADLFPGNGADEIVLAGYGTRITVLTARRTRP